MGFIKKIIVFGLAVYSYHDYAIGGNIYYYTLGALLLFLLFFVFGLKKFFRFVLYFLMAFIFLMGNALDPLGILIMFIPSIILYFILFRKKATMKFHLISIIVAMILGEITMLLFSGGWLGFTSAGAFLFFINLEILDTSETYEIIMKHEPEEIDLLEFEEENA